MIKFLKDGCFGVSVLMIMLVVALTIGYISTFFDEDIIRYKKLHEVTGTLITTSPLSSRLNCRQCAIYGLNVNIKDETYRVGNPFRYRKLAFLFLAEDLKIKIKNRVYKVIIPDRYIQEIANKRSSYMKEMTEEALNSDVCCGKLLKDRLKGVSYDVDQLFVPRPEGGSPITGSFNEAYYPLNKEVTMKGEIIGEYVVLLY